MIHYDLALRSVNERIKIPVDRISDSIIGAIAGFICHNVRSSPKYIPDNNSTDDSNQHIKGRYDQWRVHMKGINDMITLRGGIAAFDENKELRLTIMWYGQVQIFLSSLTHPMES